MGKSRKPLKTLKSARCDVCGILVPCASGSWMPFYVHILSRKHQKLSLHHRPSVKAPNRSVTITVDESLAKVKPIDLFMCLKSLGPVSDMSYGVTLSLVRSSKVIVVFVNESSAQLACCSSMNVDGIPFNVEPLSPQLLSTISKTVAPIAPKREIETLRPITIPWMRELIIGLVKLRGHKKPKEKMEWLKNQLLLSPAENQARLLLCRHLEDYISRSLRQRCSVHPFGSSLSGTGFHGCNLDIYIELQGSMAGTNDDRAMTQSIVELLRMAPPSLCTDVNSCLHLPVPYIKIQSLSPACSCDIYFHNKINCRSSLLIYELMKLDARAHLLVVCIRFWAQVWKISAGPGGMVFKSLSSYCLTLMVIVYLQQLKQPVLPAVVTLQQQSDSSSCDVWDSGFNMAAATPTSNTDTAYVLMRGFFVYYASLDLDKVVLSPFLGVAVDRGELLVRCRSPNPALHRYFQAVRVRRLNALECKTSLVVQDPFQLNRNVARKYKDEGLRRFVRTCRQACDKSFFELFRANEFSCLEGFLKGGKRKNPVEIMVPRKVPKLGADAVVDDRQQRKVSHHGESTAARAPVNMPQQGAGTATEVITPGKQLRADTAVEIMSPGRLSQVVADEPTDGSTAGPSGGTSVTAISGRAAGNGTSNHASTVPQISTNGSTVKIATVALSQADALRLLLLDVGKSPFSSSSVELVASDGSRVGPGNVLSTARSLAGMARVVFAQVLRFDCQLVSFDDAPSDVVAGLFCSADLATWRGREPFHKRVTGKKRDRIRVERSVTHLMLPTLSRLSVPVKFRCYVALDMNDRATVSIYPFRKNNTCSECCAFVSEFLLGMAKAVKYANRYSSNI